MKNCKRSLLLSFLNSFEYDNENFRVICTLTGSLFSMMMQPHALSALTPCQPPRLVSPHALSAPTPCQPSRLVSPHALSALTPCQPSRLVSPHALSAPPSALSAPTPCQPPRLVNLTPCQPRLPPPPPHIESSFFIVSVLQYKRPKICFNFYTENDVYAD